MSQYFKVHPVNPQRRLLERTAEILEQGGVIAYPTDSSYALGCRVADKTAVERLRRIRQTGVDHDFTLVCRDLSEISGYARIENWAYRMIRALTPGPFTFILQATREVPKRLQDPKKRTVGIRVPDHRIVADLLEIVGEPITSSTLQLPGDSAPMTEAEDIRERLEKQLDAVVDGGACGMEPTTVLDVSGGEIALVRQGKGDASAFLS